MKQLKTRTLSALVLGAMTLTVIYLGGWTYNAFLLIGGGIALYEWVQLSLKTKHRVLLSLGGGVYIGAAVISFYIIRSEEAEIAFMFFAVVWASDVGAYLFGKLIGGRKLIPSISPNKTWAGLLGACIFPMGGLVFLGETFSFVVIIGIAIGVTAQAGDLIVSKLKRAANSKDSGVLIPGHGGLLDRIDSLLLVSVFLAGLMSVMWSGI